MQRLFNYYGTRRGLVAGRHLPSYMNMCVDAQQEDSSKKPKPHNFLWFPDGNVILATDSYLFKVHKSLLSLHSSVFKDMFELPNVDGVVSDKLNITGTALELYEDLPLVLLVGDKGEDVVHLLRTIYEHRYHD